MPSVKRAHLGYFAELKNSKNRRKPGAWRESGTLHEVGFVGILRNLKTAKIAESPERGGKAERSMKWALWEFCGT